MFEFNKELVESRLEALKPGCRVIFAASCAERLFPLYKEYSERFNTGDAHLVRLTLDAAWASVLGKPDNTIQLFLESYDPLVPGDDAEWTVLNPLAENAVLALAYTCHCIKSGASDLAAWAAVQAYEAVDYVAQSLGENEFTGLEDEIQRQLRHLSEMEARTFSLDPQNVDRLRTRATLEGIELLPIISTLTE